MRDKSNHEDTANRGGYVPFGYHSCLKLCRRAATKLPKHAALKVPTIVTEDVRVDGDRVILHGCSARPRS